MVVMRACATDSTITAQERTGWPSRCTVQAPHNPAPQPNFVPVKPRLSRSTHSSGVPASNRLRASTYMSRHPRGL